MKPLQDLFKKQDWELWKLQSAHRKNTMDLLIGIAIGMTLAIVAFWGIVGVLYLVQKGAIN